MIPIESLVTFVFASALLSIAPGPDNIFVLTQSALYGRRSGLLITLGLCTGLIVHTSLVAFGIAAIFQASSVAFMALKIVGALYLLYLAWLAFTAGTSDLESAASTQRSGIALYQRGILMNLSNPKVSIFFLAFLPQFTSLENGELAPQIFILGILFIVVASIIFGTIAMLAGTLGAWLRKYSKTQVYLNRLAGTVFVALALNLLVAQNSMQ